MMPIKRFILYPAICGLFIALLTACSTNKNTAGSRFYHAFTARYNTYYNGEMAYKEGVQAQQQGHQDNFTEMLPLFINTNKKTAAIGKSNFETAVEKCEKTIRRHSIKKKPVRKAGRKSAKQKAFLAQKEYNPFLKNAWILLGKAQMQKGEFLEAAATFSYIIRLYANQPNITAEARLLQAQCYTAIDWLYDAEDALNKVKRDSLPNSCRKTREATLAHFYLQQHDFQAALPHLEKTAKGEHRKALKGRLYYLLGQVYQQNGQSDKAYKALNKCIHTNPRYQLEFNARILQTEVLSKQQNKKMVARLQRMAVNPKNADYLDQVYYAIGNIHLNRRDTLKAIGAYETGVTKATRSGIEKGVLLLQLGNVYWNRKNYIEAQRCYQQAIGLIDKENKDYEQASGRSAALDEAVVPLREIKLQDSLQHLAVLPESQRNAAIDRVIEALKKKEKEEKKAQAEMNAQQQAGRNPAAGFGNNRNNPNTATSSPNNSGSKEWYFYNPTLVDKGKQDFNMRWGNRKNEDNWRRNNKTVLASENTSPTDTASANTDSTALAMDSTAVAQDSVMAAKDKKKKNKEDDALNDPHKREYYMAQIPFTDEQLAESNNKLMEALFSAAVLEKERLEDYDLSLSTFHRLVSTFPDFTKMDEVNYHLFLLYLRNGDHWAADSVRRIVTQNYPESHYAQVLSDPHFERNAVEGKHLEDSLYATTYDAYIKHEYATVRNNVERSTKEYPDGKHRAKFLFLQAMTDLDQRRYAEFKEELKDLVKRYPQSEVSELAGLIVKGIDNGRILQSGAYDNNNLWGRRTTAQAADSTGTAPKWSDDRIAPFIFLMAYPQGTVNQKRLLFELARYNFTSFMARNFDITTATQEGVEQMQVTGFNSYTEAHAYAQQLFRNKDLQPFIKASKCLIISEKNLSLLGTVFSYDDYEKFYAEKFAPLPAVPEFKLDTPPVEIITDEDDHYEGEDAEDENNNEEVDY